MEVSKEERERVRTEGRQRMEACVLREDREGKRERVRTGGIKTEWKRVRTEGIKTQWKRERVRT